MILTFDGHGHPLRALQLQFCFDMPEFLEGRFRNFYSVWATSTSVCFFGTMYLFLFFSFFYMCLFVPQFQGLVRCAPL